MSYVYEDLAGGVGRRVYFRAKRYRARTRLKEVPPAVMVGDVSASLHDFSMTGLSVRVLEMPKHLSVGAILPLSVKLKGVPAYSGRAELVRAENGSRGTTLGIKLLDGLLDPLVLQEAHDRSVVEDAVARGTDRFLAIGPEYRQLCGDAAFFLQYWRASLDRLENAGESSFSVEFRSQMEAAAEDRMRSEWNEIRSRGNSLTQMLSPGDPSFGEVKRYTEIQLTPLLLAGPIWKRAYEKPLGYPGDFLLMTYMYDEARLGPSAFGRILHQLGREERLAATVPSRKDLLCELIRQLVRERSVQRAERVSLLSIGAGPARELEEFLASDESNIPLVVSLVDQDEEALAFACERLRKAALRHMRQVEIRARYIAFGQLMTRADLLTELRGQDMIYSAGLVDYLSDHVAQGLLSLCYELAGPGGLLVFGNALSAPDVRWVPEFLLDWRMIYRSESDFGRLASCLPGDAKISMRTDPSKAWGFLLVEKHSSGGQK